MRLRLTGVPWNRTLGTKCFRLGLEQTVMCLDQEVENISST